MLQEEGGHYEKNEKELEMLRHDQARSDYPDREQASVKHSAAPPSQLSPGKGNAKEVADVWGEYGVRRTIYEAAQQKLMTTAPNSSVPEQLHAAIPQVTPSVNTRSGEEVHLNFLSGDAPEQTKSSGPSNTASSTEWPKTREEKSQNSSRL